ncbi:sporulation protein YpjB [Aquibacillus kalidii]|uniref:sporulation protein YpjB n=1 Tax=Aquibacillus kalidii TaxID=2762597 RepID=UPI0016469667|nr:sporulation protein YpjB [Aquibacillus kalidii]
MRHKTSHVIILLTLSLLIGIGTLSFQATTLANHKSLVETVHQYDRFVEQQRYDSAKALLTDHKAAITKLFEDNAPNLLDELSALLETNVEVINDKTFSKEYKRAQSLSLLLAVDSVNNPEDPIWFKWKTDLEQTVSTLMSAEDVNQNQLQTLISEWTIMKPALQLSLDEENYQQLATAFRNLENNEGTKKQELQTVFNEMQTINLTDSLNPKNSINFVWMILIVGGFITLTLSYVAWKKYKGEKISQKQMIN